MTKDKIEAYFAARESLLKCFDTEYAELIESFTHCQWTYNSGEIDYLNDNEMYAFDSASLVGESEGYKLYNVYDNGSRIYALFHVDKKLTDEDEIERKFDY
tara:strand:+ start:34061 stop:34363 length:303 start_codon:yes stop_codon:yes gene_type:complete